MGPSATIQHVRHIAAQGLPAQMAIAAMVDTLENIVPTRTRTYVWADANGLPCDTYERDLIPAAVEEFNYLSPQLAADPDSPSFDKMLHSSDEFGGWRRFLRMPGWDRSALKNVIFRAYGIGNNLDFPIRDAAGRSRAVLAIGREPGSKAYTRHEIEAVLSLRPHFVHAMNSAAALSETEALAGDGEVEVVLVGSDGSISSASQRGELMLFQLRPQSSWSQVPDNQTAPAAVLEVVRRLIAARDGLNFHPPSMEVSTPWSRFRIIAHTVSGPGEAVVSLQRLLPSRLRRLQRVAGLDLSPREREVAVAMCGRGNGDDIARSVGLSAPSYREYARRIYRRLGVEGRSGVVALLDR